MKKIITGLCLGMLIVFMSSCSSQSSFPKNQLKNAYISLDINPSIEIITGEDGLVKSVVGLNDDAKVLLVDLNFTGKTVEDTINEILKNLNAMGYIKDADINEILFTTDAFNKQVLDECLEKIVSDYQKESHENIKFIRGEIEASEEMKKEAEALNISLGKLRLISTISKYDTKLTKERLKEKSILELNLILLKIRKELADLVSDQLEKGYHDLKQKLENEEEKMEILALINFILTADDTSLEKFLSKQMSVLEFKELCTNLKIEIEDLTIEIDSSTQLEIDALEEKINALEEEIKTLKTLLKDSNLMNEDKKKVKKDLDLKRNLLDDFEMQREDYEDLYDYEEKIEEIMENFEEQLENMDIDFEDIEDYFEDMIEESLEDLERENELILKQYKEECKNKKEDIQKSLKEEKDFLKSLKE